MLTTQPMLIDLREMWPNGLAYSLPLPCGREAYGGLGVDGDMSTALPPHVVMWGDDDTVSSWEDHPCSRHDFDRW